MKNVILELTPEEAAETFKAVGLSKESYDVGIRRGDFNNPGLKEKFIKSVYALEKIEKKLEEAVKKS